MTKLQQYIVYLQFFIYGLLFYHLFLGKRTVTVVEEKETIVKETDTLYVELPKDTIFIPLDNIKQVVIRDTVIVDYKPLVRAYFATYENLYGNLKIHGDVLGELMSMEFVPDFRFPVVTNTVTKTRTVVERRKGGLYLGTSITIGGFTQNYASTEATYVSDKNLVGYSYNVAGIHTIRYGRRFF